MKKKYLFILLFIIVFSGGCFFIAKNYIKNRILGQKPKEALLNIVSEVKGEEKAKNTNPLYIETYAEKEYDGRDLALEKKLEENKFYTRYLISYMSGEYKISGVMNVPKGDGQFPVLFLNHGLVNPDKYSNGKGFEKEQDYFARRGYITFYSDYRNIDPKKLNLDNANMALGYMDDVINAVTAVKSSSLPYFDKDKFGMLGHSMGGGLTLNAAVTQPNLVKAYALFAPISADQRDNYRKWVEKKPEIVKAVNVLIGSPEDNPEFWDKISAASYLDRITAPIAIHHGTRDSVVPIEWSRRLSSNLKDKKKEVEFYEYKGEGHNFDAAWAVVLERTAKFMDENLRG